MKRRWIIGLVGLALAVAGYGTVYWTRTACCRVMQQSAAPDLAWLKQEFHLSDAEFKRVSELHDAYQPACQERCRRIDAKSSELRQLLARSADVTPEVERALADAAALRRDCETAMLRHFVAVSRAMPPEQGQRYLVWISSRTLSPAHESMAPGAPADPAHVHSGN